MVIHSQPSITGVDLDAIHVFIILCKRRSQRCPCSLTISRRPLIRIDGQVVAPPGRRRMGNLLVTDAAQDLATLIRDHGGRFCRLFTCDWSWWLWRTDEGRVVDDAGTVGCMSGILHSAALAASSLGAEAAAIPASRLTRLWCLPCGLRHAWVLVRGGRQWDVHCGCGRSARLLTDGAPSLVPALASTGLTPRLAAAHVVWRTSTREWIEG